MKDSRSFFIWILLSSSSVFSLVKKNSDLNTTSVALKWLSLFYLLQSHTKGEVTANKALTLFKLFTNFIIIIIIIINILFNFIIIITIIIIIIIIILIW